MTTSAPFPTCKIHGSEAELGLKSRHPVSKVQAFSILPVLWNSTFSQGTLGGCHILVFAPWQEGPEIGRGEEKGKDVKNKREPKSSKGWHGDSKGNQGGEYLSQGPFRRQRSTSVIRTWKIYCKQVLIRKRELRTKRSKKDTKEEMNGKCREILLPLGMTEGVAGAGPSSAPYRQILTLHQLAEKKCSRGPAPVPQSRAKKGRLGAERK